ncbi:hypothetical protein [Cryobacterium psychrophilum]|uniref:Uncharacterized protein n=1 Tax=Cryobacterium psychrophilum TaxID=41988 RepID=A0A4Y8KLZ1_9MICO|nr:hypothetical protein [Cryobacterium psychrophilum]TDW30148.1 hypothetical protein EDD25_1891 [Cryobacterium psychrophilum]TFD77380.1 hypothetical protein E3T53_11165 [Cryobacterium psychrophilum]
MAPTIRLLLAFSAIGAGLIHLAVGAGAPFPLSVLLVGFGIAELGWAVATLSTGRIVLPRLMLGGALVPVAVWAATATLGSGLGVSAQATGLPLFPMFIASLFNIFLAVTLAVIARKAASGLGKSIESAKPAGWKFATALVLGGVIFSGLTTLALAATNAGLYAVPHGSHSVPGLEFLESDAHAGH